jgi:hypothetical protein
MKSTTYALQRQVKNSNALRSYYHQRGTKEAAMNTLTMTKIIVEEDVEKRAKGLDVGPSPKR